MPRAVVSRKKRVTKTADPRQFYVAPTTPFIPTKRPATVFSVNAKAGTPSPHVVDLRAVTANRPAGSPVRATKKDLPNFSQVTVPRTISHHPDRASIWNQLIVVAFVRFLWSLVKTVAVGLGKLAALPVAAGLSLYDRFDLDRRAESRPRAAIQESRSKKQEAEPKIVEEKNSAPQPEPTRYTLHATRKFNMRRALISFAGTSLAIILPLQGMNAFRALEAIKTQAQTARDTSLAALNGEASFSDAEAAIGTARKSVANLGQVANALIEKVPRVGGEFRSGKALLEAGDDLSTAAALLSKSFAFMDDPSLSLTDKIGKAQDLAERSEPLLASAKDALKSADQLPAGMESSLGSLRDEVASMDDLTRGFINLAPALRNILGETQARRYLVLFQNNAELRPTGGFIGSFALIDVDRGEVKRVEVPAGGSYDLQGALKASVLAPEPLRLISAKWEFQDGNWFPDFPTSAKKLTWFYNQSSGPTVDGVIAINAPVLAKLLDAVGPISMPEYKTIATGTTVLQTAQEIVESQPARASGKPKQFIADLLPRVLAKLTTSGGDDALTILKIFAQSLEEKDIQMSFADPAAAKAFANLGWTGQLATVPAGFDSLGLVRTNIAGGKTDTVMQTKITHQSEIDADGHVTDHVTIAMTHQGHKGDAFTGVRNVTYLRLYVPEGSRLLKASGDIRPPAYSFFDLPPEGCAPDQTLADISGVTVHDPNTGTAVNNEFGRTVFGVWTQTDPGTTTTVSFDYRLPFVVTPTAAEPTLTQKIGLAAAPTASAEFGLLMEKQSGADNTEIQSTLKLPAGWYPSLAAPEGIAQTDGWSFTSQLSADRAIGMIIAK